MKTKIIRVFLLALLFSSCSTTQESQSTPAEEIVYTQTAFPEATPNGSVSTETATQEPIPFPLPTLAPTSNPVSQVIGPENIFEVSPVQNYSQTIDNLILEQFGIEMGKSRTDMWTYSPDGRYVAVGGCTTLASGDMGLCYDKYSPENRSFLYVLNAQTAELIVSIPDDQNTISGLAFSPDGKWLAYAVCPQRAVLWNMETQQEEMMVWQGSKCSSFPKVVFSPNSLQLAMVVDTRLILFDVATGSLINELPAQRWGSVLPKYSRDGTRLAVFSASDGHEVAIYDTTTWQRVSLIKISNQEVGSQAVDFSSDGKWIVTAETGEDTDPVLWDATTGEQVAVLDEPLIWLESMAFTPDGRLLLVSGLPADISVTDSIAVWDMTSHQRLGTIPAWLTSSRIMFAEDGESFVMRDDLFGWPERWSLPDADMLTAREALINMFDALSAGDYQTAARLFQPSPEDMEYLRTTGFDPTNLQEMLSRLCAQEFGPCLMEYQIRFGGLEPYVPYQGDSQKSYYFIVTFTTVDGSIYRDPYDQTEFQIYVDFLPDDSVRVITLPYFFYGNE